MPREIKVIGLEIRQNWKNVNYGAEPYLRAMSGLSSINDTYYQDTAKKVVNYFLANSGTWRGEVARRIKKELKAL